MAMFDMATGKRLFKVQTASELALKLDELDWLDRLDYLPSSMRPLFVQLLVLDAKERATAAAALNNEWLKF